LYVCIKIREYSKQSIELNNHKKIIFLLCALPEDSPKSTFCKNKDETKMEKARFK